MVLPLALALLPPFDLAGGGGAEDFRVERDCLDLDLEVAFLAFDVAGAFFLCRRIRPPSSSSSSSRWVVSKAVASSSSSSDDMSYSVRLGLGWGLSVRLGRRARRVAVDIAVGFLVVLLRVLAGSGGGGDSCVRGSA